MPKLKTEPELKVALVLLASYLAFGILQVPSYLKMEPPFTLVDSLVSLSLFAALLFPAAYAGSRMNPASVVFIQRLICHGRSVPGHVLRRVLLALVLALLAFCINLGLTALFTRVWTPPTTQDYIHSFNLFDKMAASISSGLWEETIFRFFLFSAALSVLKRRLPAVLLSNLVFTLMHAVFQQPPYNLSALTIVYLLGLVYSKCYTDQGLEPAVICHAAMNLLTMTLGLML